MRPMLRFAVALLALAAAPACSITVESNEGVPPAVSDLEALADELAERAVDDGATAGISIAVRRDGATLFSKGYGLADIENDVQADAETVYRIGSVTKQFTAAAIMLLVEQGEIDLDADFREYAPEFDTGGQTVTVEQLLNHTSGIPSYTGLGETWQRTIPLALTHDELLGMVQGRPFDFAPGDSYAYNNTGYYLLGVIIETVTGGTYADYIEEQLAAPLKLGSTLYCDERRVIPHRAEGYERVDDALLNDPPIDMTQPFAAGALCSTVDDLLRWQEALAGGEVVSADSFERMTTPGSLNDESALEYGYGLGLGDLEGHRRVRHGGGINGFVTMLARYPDDDLAIVVLANTPGPTAGQITQRLARQALGLPAPASVEERP